MRSKAHIKSHPVHPILVAFPIAFFTGTFVFDVLWLFTGNTDHSVTAGYLNIAGIIGAVAAAIPGIIDYTYTVPPASSAKKRATKHALINSTVLLLFIGVYLYRNGNQPTLAVAGIEAVAMILLGIAGWMGGTLVYRNQVGVDIRYAGAGKWNEEHIEGAGDVQVATAGELKLNQMKLVHVNDKRIVISKTETGYVAFSDHCTHRGGSLAGGAIMCGTVQCPWHGSQFDVATGEVKAGPAEEKIQVYEVYESKNNIYLKLNS